MAQGTLIWQDLLLDRWIEVSSLQAAMVRAFGVPADRVAVIDDPGQLAAVSPSVQVIVERTRQHRDLPLQLLVVLRDEGLAARFNGVAGAVRVARELAAQLGATVLFAEGPLAPSEWIRVRPIGRVDIVALDAGDASPVESYAIVAERALSSDELLAATETASPTE